MTPSRYWIEVDGHAVPAESQGISRDEWARWFENSGEQRRVARDTIGGLDVSTVFLGINHTFDALPMLYETMVFENGDGDLQWRYRTREAAEEGHAKVCAALRAGASLQAVGVLEIEP